MGKLISGLREALGSIWRRSKAPAADRARAEEPAMAKKNASAPDPSASSHVAKQAVILVHGMGEQIPMDTIKGFVRTAWETDTVITANQAPNSARVWSKPDDRTGSLELRRITTRESIARPAFPGGVRTDFYELYWADLTAGSTWDQFTGWVRYLLFRRWSRVPKDVRGVWLVLLFGSIAVVLIGCLNFIPDAWWKAHVPWWLPQKLMIALFAGAGALLNYYATRTFGRVVRYTRADPDNIASRAAVRKRGLELLRALHADGSYARIVLVGHSLGTILAYDLLSYFWAEQTQARTVEEGSAGFPLLCAVEKAAAALQGADGETQRADYARAQRAFRQWLATRDAGGSARRRWLISDFVTFGSPLTHAEFLLASSEADLAARHEARELPVSPPYREELDPEVFAAAVATGTLPTGPSPQESRLIAFPDVIGSGRWMLHHAAPFAAVRWTNVHDPARLVALGDVISGPLSTTFGRAITDIDLSIRDRRSWRFTHTRYWAPDQRSARISAFREAINLADEAVPIPGVSFDPD
jgi:hypothetical protein